MVAFCPRRRLHRKHLAATASIDLQSAAKLGLRLREIFGQVEAEVVSKRRNLGPTFLPTLVPT